MSRRKVLSQLEQAQRIDISSDGESSGRNACVGELRSIVFHRMVGFFHDRERDIPTFVGKTRQQC
jgi:hypothetical protein